MWRLGCQDEGCISDQTEDKLDHSLEHDMIDNIKGM